MKKQLKSLVAIMTIMSVVTLGVMSGSTSVAATDMNLESGVGSSQGDNVPPELTGDTGVFTVVVNILLFVIGAVSVIMLIYGGIRYTTSGGNATAVTSAKNTLMYSIVGLVIAILAYAVVNCVVSGLME